jgi:DNA topoisomerase 2-associated protein PAT1
MMPVKGKKLLTRVARHFNSQQLLTILTLLVACFNQLDVVREAPLLDSGVESPERAEVAQQTQTFLATIFQCISPVIAKSNMRLIGGLLGLFMERCEVHIVARSRVSYIRHISLCSY